MKKGMLLVGAVVAITFASCKKDYNCVCTYKDGNGASATYTYDMGKVKKKDAKDACNTMGSLYILAGGGCEAKAK